MRFGAREGEMVELGEWIDDQGTTVLKKAVEALVDRLVELEEVLVAENGVPFWKATGEQIAGRMEPGECEPDEE